ncbi:hypothetical protein [Caballeronia glathei]|uniref:hypothetical protein n=1 Tax=Caballeronia glathei TaxID=60547 RepID=UPI0015935BB5|nr:hypothetical protein [Caballeronia glathei]
MGQLTTVGIDLVKNVFAICVLDATARYANGACCDAKHLCDGPSSCPHAASQWKPVLRQTTGVAGLPPVVTRFGSFRSSSSSHSGRRARTMRLMPKQSPLRPGSRRCVLSRSNPSSSRRCWLWYSVREGWQQERTALMNRTRELLAEFGVVIARSADRFVSALQLIEDVRLPDPVRAMLVEVRE